MTSARRQLRKAKTTGTDTGANDMATLDTKETTPVASLRRALTVVERLMLPVGISVSLHGWRIDAVPDVKLHPYTHTDHMAVRRRLALHGWERGSGSGAAWRRTTVDGVDVTLFDVREGA